MEATQIVSHVVPFPQSVSVLSPDFDFIEDSPEECDDTDWQDFLTYCAEVQS